MIDKKLYDIALSYVGTPHRNGGNIKKVGLDCCTLITQILQEAGYGTVPITFGYSCDWFCKINCKEILLPYLEKHCFRKDKMEAGDVLSFRWGRAKYAHLALYLGDNKVVHCSADFGTEITDLNNPYFYDYQGRSRISGIWGIDL